MSSSVIDLLRTTSVKVQNSQREISRFNEKKNLMNLEIKTLEKEIEDLSTQFESIRDECKQVAIERNLDREGNLFRKESELSIAEQIKIVEDKTEKHSKEIHTATSNFQQQLYEIMKEQQIEIKKMKNPPQLPDFPTSKQNNLDEDEKVQKDEEDKVLVMEATRKLAKLFMQYDELREAGLKVNCKKCGKEGLICDED